MSDAESKPTILWVTETQTASSTSSVMPVPGNIEALMKDENDRGDSLLNSPFVGTTVWIFGDALFRSKRSTSDKERGST